MAHHAWSLRWLIGGIYFCIMVVILGALALFSSRELSHDYRETVHSTLVGKASLAADLLAPSFAATPDRPNHYPLLPNNRVGWMLGHIASNPSIRYVALLDTDGSIISEYPRGGLLSSKSAHGLTPEVKEVLAHETASTLSNGSGVGSSIRVNPTTDELTQFIAVPIKPLPNPKSQIDSEQKQPASSDSTTPKPTLAFLVLAAPLKDVQTWVARISIGIGIAFGCMLLVLVFVNFGVSTLISNPLATLSAAAERFAHGNLNERVHPAGAHEVASLGESFNRMARDLRHTITRLAAERAQAEAMLISMVDGVVVTDTSGTILLINASAEQLLGLTKTMVIGKTLNEAVLHFEMHDLLTKILATGLPLKQEITLTYPTERTLEVHMAPVEVEEHYLGVVIVLYDVTQQRKVEQIHRDFVANVSHELRTPVASIRAMAETLLDSGEDVQEIAPSFLPTIIEESERLTAMLDDLLNLSRLEAGHRMINPTTFDLPALIRQVAQRIIVPMNQKNQRLLLELPESLAVTADRDAFIQIMLNLLDNARKYSAEDATVSVRISYEQDLRVMVADTGYGIPANEVDRIFERFYRVDKARSRSQGGTGLGLSIVRQLVELHGGRIDVDSELGVGSAFTVIIPRPHSAIETLGEAGELPFMIAASELDDPDTVA